MSSITIKKGKIKNNLFLAYEYSEKVGTVINVISTTSDAPIHEDLRSAFRGLSPHLAFLSEQISEKKMKQLIKDKVDPEDEFWQKYEVISFSIGGSGDTEGVTLSGKKHVETGVINFNTPFTKWDSEYKFIDELYDVVEAAKHEVYEYLNGKQAPSTQHEINFDDFDTGETFDDEANVPVADPDYQESIAAFKRATKGMKVSISTSNVE